MCSLTAVKRLASLILCCAVSAVSYGQQTVDVPILIILDDQSPISLNPSDLKAEVGRQPVPVTSITPLAGERLQYVLLNDASGGTRWPGGTRQQTEVEEELLRQVIVAGSDIGGLVNFNDEFYLDVKNEKDPQKLVAKLERKGRGGTATYDAVVSAANRLGKQALAPGLRKVMFLFCDGEDNASRSSSDQATEALQRTGIPIFIVAPSSIETSKQGVRLHRLASESGGRVYFLPRDTRPVKFDLLKRDLAQSFLLKMAVPLLKGPKMQSVAITDVNNPRIHVISPSQIPVPR